MHHHVTAQEMAEHIGLIVVVELKSMPGDKFDVRLQAVDEEFAYFGRTGLPARAKIPLANIKSVERVYQRGGP